MSFNQGIPGPATLINSSSTLLYGNSASANALSVQQLGAGNVATFRTTTGATALFVSSAGNVGVGTTVTGSVLDVYTADTTYGIRHTTGTIAIASYIASGSTTAPAQIGTTTNHKLGFYTNNGGPSVILDTNGRLGIGTASPQTPLDVYSGVAYNASGVIGSAVSLGTNLGNSLPRPNLSPASANTSIWGYNFAGPAADDGFLRLAAGGGTNNASKTYIDMSGYSTIPDMVNTIVMGTGGTERMRITNPGYVGIGTTNPGAPLHTTCNSASATTVATFENLNITNTTNKSFNIQFYGRDINFTQKDVGSINIIPTDGNFGYSAMAFSIRGPFGAGSSEAVSEVMRFTHSGTTPCVGIGNQTPPIIFSVACTTSGPIGSDPTGIDVKNGNVDLLLGTNATTNSGSIQVVSGGTVSTVGSSPYTLFLNPRGGTIGIGTTVNPGSNLYVQGTMTVTGAMTKGSGTFDISHPILPDPKRLCHSFIEGPRCDLIYRGSVQIVNGAATVNIDADCTSNAAHAMTQGTFEALCTNPVCFLQNDDSFDRIRGKVTGNILNITCENDQSSDVVNWMVVAERKDPFIKQWDRTDPDGFLIPEYDPLQAPQNPA